MKMIKILPLILLLISLRFNLYANQAWDSNATSWWLIADTNKNSAGVIHYDGTLTPLTLIRHGVRTIAKNLKNSPKQKKAGLMTGLVGKYSQVANEFGNLDLIINDLNEYGYTKYYHPSNRSIFYNWKFLHMYQVKGQESCHNFVLFTYHINTENLPYEYIEKIINQCSSIFIVEIDYFDTSHPNYMNEINRKKDIFSKLGVSYCATIVTKEGMQGCIDEITGFRTEKKFKWDSKSKRCINPTTKEVGLNPSEGPKDLKNAKDLECYDFNGISFKYGEYGDIGIVSKSINGSHFTDTDLSHLVFEQIKPIEGVKITRTNLEETYFKTGLINSTFNDNDLNSVSVKGEFTGNTFNLDRVHHLNIEVPLTSSVNRQNEFKNITAKNITFKNDSNRVTDKENCISVSIQDSSIKELDIEKLNLCNLGIENTILENSKIEEVQILKGDIYNVKSENLRLSKSTIHRGSINIFLISNSRLKETGFANIKPFKSLTINNSKIEKLGLLYSNVEDLKINSNEGGTLIFQESEALKTDFSKSNISIIADTTNLSGSLFNTDQLQYNLNSRELAFQNSKCNNCSFSNTKASSLISVTSELNGSDFSNLYTDNFLTQESYLNNSKFNNARLNHIESNASFFNFCDFTQASGFRDSLFLKTNFNDTNFNQVAFTNATIVESNFVRANFKDAFFSSGMSLEKDNFTGANFYNAKVDGLIFIQSNLNEVKQFGAHGWSMATGIQMDMTTMENAEIRGGFRDANIHNSSFSGTNLNDVTLSGTFVNTRFIGADLNNAKFQNAFLKDLNFTNASLRNATFFNISQTGLIFDNADLTGVSGL